MGRQRRKLRLVIGVLKDKASLVKASLSTNRYNSSAQRLIVHATTHNSSSPPSDDRIAAVIALGHGSRATACACIESITDRLGGTRNAYVALKCLFIIHNIIKSGSFILKDQLLFCPLFGGRNFLNLSKFCDDSDPDTWGLSSWLRWYAAFLERNLQRVSKIELPRLQSNFSGKEIILGSNLLSSDWLMEVNNLVSFVEQICDPPDSLYLKSNDLVYEIVGLVGEDYGLAQRELFVRVGQLVGRVMGLSITELTHLLSSLNRLEVCRERARLLFVNKKKNDSLWELVAETKKMVVEALTTKKTKRDGEMMVIRLGGGRSESYELTQFGVFGQGFAEPSQELAQFGSGSVWLGLDRVSLVASARG
ncbi:putative clathrin assembly protein At4g40080 [Carica papaya]|uniref:putative clathrin assembly protein At4g40080 n=1 Tax=Carica papaya TaxID=3649 RepID=UPI000B8CF9BB|nr:putative clathrin assembly protein At4g40080 [Carica papaya]